MLVATTSKKEPRALHAIENALQHKGLSLCIEKRLDSKLYFCVIQYSIKLIKLVKCVHDP